MPRERADPRLGNAVRQLREQAAITQEELAYEAGISVGALSRVERAHTNPSWTTVERIAEALEVSLVALVEAVERPPS